MKELPEEDDDGSVAPPAVVEDDDLECLGALGLLGLVLLRSITAVLDLLPHMDMQTDPRLDFEDLMEVVELTGNGGRP